MKQPPFATLDFAPVKVDVERRDDGSMIFTSGYPLEPFPDSVPSMLHRWEDEAPERVWLAERPAPPVTDAPWRTMTYGEAGDAVRRLGQALLDNLLEGLARVGVNGGIASQPLPAPHGDVDVLGIELDRAADPARLFGGDDRRAATGEGVEHDVAPPGAFLDCVGDQGNRLDRRMHFQLAETATS